MINVQNLTKRFAAKTAVDRVSFQVPSGKIVGFLGPNGAGKSTTLKMISGFLPPTSGSVSVAGFDVVDQPVAARKHLGYMPEAVPLYPEMRVVEYLTFRAEIKDVPRKRIRSAVEQAMKLVDISDVARQLIGELSKGYKQRVGLADALVADPGLLILDEPTSGFDPNQIVQVRELIKSLGEKHTIFLSTHILPEVEAVCDSVIIIARGKVVAQGTIDEIRAQRDASSSSESRSAILVVRSPDKSPVELLNAVPFVRSVEATVESGQPNENVYRCIVQLDNRQKNAETHAEQLIAHCVNNSLGVRSFQFQQLNLESIFQELTLAKTDSDNQPPVRTNNKETQPS